MLQIESICDEGTDDAILAALRDLPTNLPAIYERIIRKSFRAKFTKKILQLFLSACRPLGIWELREALSVIPGDNTMDRKKFVNDIYKTISRCGSLLELSEDALTVHFIHPSAKQHLLEYSVDTRTHFSDIEANRLMGGICITYLSWGGFETRVTTHHTPWSISGSETVSAATVALQSTTISKKVAQLYLRKTRRQSPSGSSSFDFKRVLMDDH